MNQKLIGIVIGVLVIIIVTYFVIISSEFDESTSTENIQIDKKPEMVPIEIIPATTTPNIIPTDVYSLFKTFSYENDFEMIDGTKIWRNSFYELDKNNLTIYDDLMNNKKSAVILPLFTAAAYSEPGFYTYYRGECDQEFHGILFRDDDCLTIQLKDEYSAGFTGSGAGTQILNLLGYELITDIQVHQNPTLLLQYEKIILLHNEYVTSVEFDAIISHPNVIYLYPNALYAEIDFDEELWQISLVRGHNYPEITIRNGFDWKFDNSLEEYDVTCENMKFTKIDNGWMLNCYPENILHKSKELLKQINDF